MVGNHWFTVYIVTQQLFRHCCVFCFKSEMTRMQLPAMQSQWRALDCSEGIHINKLHRVWTRRTEFALQVMDTEGHKQLI